MQRLAVHQAEVAGLDGEVEAREAAEGAVEAARGDALEGRLPQPLQWATILGFIFSIAAFLAIPLTVVARYANIFERGVPTTIIIVLLLGGIQLITLGVIGEYVGRIYDEVKRRPLYVVRDQINADAPAEAHEAARRS